MTDMKKQMQKFLLEYHSTESDQLPFTFQDLAFYHLWNSQGEKSQIQFIESWIVRLDLYGYTDLKNYLSSLVVTEIIFEWISKSISDFFWNCIESGFNEKKS